MTRDGFLCFLGFQNFPGEDPRTPFQKCVVIVHSNTAQHKTSWKSEVYNSRSGHLTHKVAFTSLICDLLAKNLLHPLSAKYRAEKDQDPVKMLKFNVNYAPSIYNGGGAYSITLVRTYIRTYVPYVQKWFPGDIF